MSWFLLRTFRRAGILLGLLIVAAFSLGLAAPANAAKPKAEISASFDHKTGVLTVSGDDQDNVIGIGRDATGAILVNSGEVKVKGGKPTIANTSQIQVFGQGGNDQLALDEANGALPPTTMDGGTGNDRLVGGSGDDTFIWNPGDGSDVLEGQAGHDTMVFNGSNADELIDLSANGARLRFFRNVGNIVMDVNDVEQVDFAALGGADTVTVNDLTGTAVTKVAVDLAGTAGSGTGDGQVDSVIVNGTSGNDNVVIASSGSIQTVNGLAASVSIQAAEGQDQLRVNGLAGDDTADASGMGAVMALTLDGGDGDDVLIGSAGNDIILGGAGDDVLIGGPGIDQLDGGPGDNIVTQD